MLSREQAQERLKEFYDANWATRQQDVIASLPKELHDLAQIVLTNPPYGAPEKHRLWQKALGEASGKLDALGASDRRRVFEAVFPTMSAYVERAWQILVRSPYQEHGSRRAFRAPNEPRATRSKRIGWLVSLARVVQGYNQSLSWFATWAPYLPVWTAPSTLGVLFAAAIDAGDADGNAVFGVLRASGAGEHEIGAMGRHVTSGLLLAARPDGWEFVEKLLLAAQREEGLRQVILETVDEAHPTAFRRMLRLIREHDLARFSAIVRAVDVWFGFQYDAPSARVVNELLASVSGLLDDAEECRAALESDDAPKAYLALWSVAFGDAFAAIEPAARLLADASAARRFAAAHLLAQLGLVKSRDALRIALEDEDLRVVARAVSTMQGKLGEWLPRTDLFERLERVLPRFPKEPKLLDSIVWPWMAVSAQREMVTGVLVESLGDRPPTRLIPYLSDMNPYQRARVVDRLAETRDWDSQTRDTLFALVGDAAEVVREHALRVVARCSVTESEATSLERLLTRKTSGLRRGVISVLLNQPDGPALTSADRLLAAPVEPQRVAGLELLRQMKDSKRHAAECRERAERFRAQRRELADAERVLLDTILDREQAVPTLDDALGLLDPERRTKPTPPQAGPKPRLISEAVIAGLKSLDELVHEHRTEPVTITGWDGSAREELLGSLQYGIPRPDHGVSPREDASRLPLRAVWEQWWDQRPPRLRDDDGLEILRALASFYAWGRFQVRSGNEPDSIARVRQELFVDLGETTLRYPRIVHDVLTWLLRLDPPTRAADFLLDAVQVTFVLLSPTITTEPGQEAPAPDWPPRAALGWLDLARHHQSACPADWSAQHHVRLWRLVRWLDEPVPGKSRTRPPIGEILAAYQAGAATEDDLLDQLLGPRATDRYAPKFDELRALTGRRPSPLFATYPVLRDLVERCKQRIVDVELTRGDLPTAASTPALALRSLVGVDPLIALLRALGRESFNRGGYFHGQSKVEVFSHLIRVTFPSDDDTLDAFATKVRATQIPRQRLIELAVYAPQWVRHVEHALEWPGLTEAVWWIHAHTKDTHWQVDREIRDTWTAQVSERTPLPGQNLLDGAVDVAWFQRAYAALGSERWGVVYEAAKYASGGAGHERARHFADAMLGQVIKRDLVSRIVKKRLQDSVRALGLLPLADGADREADILERYTIVQEFVRTSRQFGSQRQASEKLAATISLENLSRTAGYPDPQRLEWAMEAQSIADLASGPVSVILEDVVVSLAIDDSGEPDLSVTRSGKPLKSIPAAVKKAPEIVALQERQRDVRRQLSRMRPSLETSMCRGNQFSGAELRDLFQHPVLAPMLRALVFIGDGMIGFPVEGGLALQSHDGVVYSVGSSDLVRIAHSYDLLETGEWHAWQQHCFASERIQPFKQIFRELYVLTRTETDDHTVSHRYAGHQVNPRQAMALLGQRGWVSHPEEGVRRTFHDDDLSAWITCLQGAFTPAEVEGLTIDGSASRGPASGSRCR